MKRQILVFMLALFALAPTTVHADWRHSIWSHPNRIAEWVPKHHTRITRRGPTRMGYNPYPHVSSARGSVMLVTMYCDYGVTASGRYVFSGEAAGGYDLPLWSRVTVAGIGSFVILDREGFRPWAHLDLWTSSCGAAIAFGAQYRMVWR